METLPEASVSSSLYDVEEERVGVPVKGGLYEVSPFSLDTDSKSVFEFSCRFITLLNH